MLHERSPFTKVTAGPSPLLTDFYSTNYSFDYYLKYAATKPLKTETSAYPKNVQTYVKYNKTLDEDDLQFNEGSRTTSVYALDYLRFDTLTYLITFRRNKSATPGGISFKNLPPVIAGHKRRHLVQTSTSSSSANKEGAANNLYEVEKHQTSRIMPSNSGFTSESEVIHASKGTYHDRFERGQKPRVRRWDEYKVISMGNDSFTRAAELFPKAKRIVASETKVLPKLQEKIKQGKKEKTGSVLENPATIIFTEKNPNYDTEMFSKFTGPKKEEKEQIVEKIDRSGFSVNNRYKPNSKVIDEVSYKTFNQL